MTGWKYILASLRQYRRLHCSVAAGVAVATAVITGALIVGDSVRGSLHDLALGSLGRIDAVLQAEHPFREALAKEWIAEPEVAREKLDAAPLMLTRGAVSRESEGRVERATGLQVVGVTPAFWSFALEPAKPPISPGNQIALTAPIAAELGVAVGDSVLLRVPAVGSVPSESTLVEKEETTVSRRMKVAAILPNAEGSLARFTLRPSQQAPRNAFVPLETLQDLLELPKAANAIALAREPSSADSPLPDSTLANLGKSLRPPLADFGLHVEAVAAPNSTERSYIRISADRLVLPPAVVAAATKMYGGAGLQPVVTYLANSIALGDKRIPYSTVAGVDSAEGVGPVLDEAGHPVALDDNEVALNDWAAEDLGAKVGDSVTIAWYEPETTHGKLREHPPLELKVRAIVSLAGAGDARTAAADAHIAPDLPGVTDQKSINDWRLPFELVEKIRDKDEAYWEKYRTAPKAFVSHALAQRLWATRWGVESVLRIPASAGRTADSIEADLRRHLNPADLGMTLLPVKRQALAAAAGTTPFDGLFLGFSFFLMASAIMLIALLYRLGVEQRAREVGLLLAVGTSPRRVRRLLLVEGAMVAAVGAAVGVVCGVGYAWIMGYGLNTWWVAATAAPFWRLHATTRSLLVGFAAGLTVAVATMWWSLRRFARLSARQLLAGDYQPRLGLKRPALWSATILPAACFLAAVGLGVAAVRWEGEAQSGAFFGGGALVLIGVLTGVRGKLREAAVGAPRSFTLAGLAVRNARRNPNRTMMSLALAATASFLIVALSAFRLTPTDRGTGGFDLLATADLPLHYDLNAEEGRRQLGFSEDDNRKLRGAEIVGFRVRDGDDASCLNLYQSSQPRVLGAPTGALAAHDQFGWASVDASAEQRQQDKSPWHLLDGFGENAARVGAFPMALDRNTAFYALKLYAVGDRLKIRDAADREVSLKVAGMLANSVLQGVVIVSETSFLHLFPETAGQRFFLIRRGPDSPPTAELASLLETQLEDFGFDAVSSQQRLAELLAVQNTYLSTFQSLGALGLLLGAVGLAIAQVRSVLERRGELALMQAAGFSRRRLVQMVLVENLVLLFGGLAIGCIAALAAVLPHAIVEQAGMPWRTLTVLLAVVAIAGTAAAWGAARSALRAPLVPALRGE